jgi:3-hydroxyisobutyrate dehydrogenase-like beta-hydroxyacid dehydrogenase
VAKLCNNLALSIEMAAVAEALDLRQKLGADMRVLSGIFNTSSCSSVLEQETSRNTIDQACDQISVVVREHLGCSLTFRPKKKLGYKRVF